MKVIRNLFYTTLMGATMALHGCGNVNNNHQKATENKDKVDSLIRISRKYDALAKIKTDSINAQFDRADAALLGELKTLRVELAQLANKGDINSHRYQELTKEIQNLSLERQLLREQRQAAFSKVVTSLTEKAKNAVEGAEAILKK